MFCIEHEVRDEEMLVCFHMNGDSNSNGAKTEYNSDDANNNKK